jgi:hypothetical protein
MFALTGSEQGVGGPAVESAINFRLPQKAENFLLSGYQLLKDSATYFRQSILPPAGPNGRAV